VTLPLEVTIDRLERRDRERIDAIVASAVPEVAPTLALVAWRSGAPVLDLQAGWMDPDDRSRSTRPDALFDLASITKTVTATLFLGLVSRQRVGLDDAVVSVIPELGEGGLRPVEGGQEPLTRRRLPTPPDRACWTADPAELTFRQLLTHTSGLAPWRSVFEAAGPVPPPAGVVDAVAPSARHAATIRAVAAYPFVDRPGRAFAYSDLGFMLLGETVSRLHGRPLDAIVRSELADGLGTRDFVYRPPNVGIELERIVPTSVDELWRHRRCWGEVEDENAAGMGGIAGHAGLFATAGAIARFGEAWRTGSSALGISPALIEEATRDQTSGLDATRGLGWQLHGDRPQDEDASHLASLGPGAFGHTGFTGTSVAIDPPRELVVVLLTNRVYASRTHKGIEDLRRDVQSAIAEAASSDIA
jgi:CubicO group peptidase (beta-lactamase class C family)